MVNFINDRKDTREYVKNAIFVFEHGIAYTTSTNKKYILATCAFDKECIAAIFYNKNKKIAALVNLNSITSLEIVVRVINELQSKSAELVSILVFIETETVKSVAHDVIEFIKCNAHLNPCIHQICEDEECAINAKNGELITFRKSADILKRYEDTIETRKSEMEYMQEFAKLDEFERTLLLDALPFKEVAKARAMNYQLFTEYDGRRNSGAKTKEETYKAHSFNLKNSGCA